MRADAREREARAGDGEKWKYKYIYTYIYVRARVFSSTRVNSHFWKRGRAATAFQEYMPSADVLHNSKGLCVLDTRVQLGCVGYTVQSAFVGRIRNLIPKDAAVRRLRTFCISQSWSARNF